MRVNGDRKNNIVLSFLRIFNHTFHETHGANEVSLLSGDWKLWCIQVSIRKCLYCCLPKTKFNIVEKKDLTLVQWHGHCEQCSYRETTYCALCVNFNTFWNLILIIMLEEVIHAFD